MNFSLKPNPLIAVWLPGFTTLCALILFGYHDEMSSYLNQSLSSGIVAALSFVAIVFGFVVGELLDSVRDLVEHLCDRLFPRIAINWDFFVSGEKQKVENLEEWFFTYYELDANLALGILTVLCLPCLSSVVIASWIRLLLIVLFLIFSLSAILMRGEVKKEIDRNYHAQ